MTSNVVQLPVITRLDLNPDITLDNLKGKLKGFVLCGYTTEGVEFFSSTYADGGNALWILKRCEKALLEQVNNE